MQAGTTAIYGDRGDQWCDERSPIGEGVPTNTAAKWETAFAATPNPVTNAKFMATLRAVLGRPWAPPTPAWAVHIGAFFMRTEPVLALTGRRCKPQRLIEHGFDFRYEHIDDTLQSIY